MNQPTVIITGAASGIGKATAIRFAAEGYQVCALDIQGDKLQELQTILSPGNHIFITGSYAEDSTIQEIENSIRQNWGSVQVLVNCAGLSAKTDALQMPISEWRYIFDCMINGCLKSTQLAAKFMQENGGSIIHISSIHGTRAEHGASSYSMAKAAINQFCRSMAVELADKKIRVNAIAPGFVNTAMSMVDGENELNSEWFLTNYVKSHHLPLRRAAEPEEIAGVAYFLAGKDASYITGQIIIADGGLTITF